jgi:23S rRNA-/tRNA-specific pseudouridylate synthase
MSDLKDTPIDLLPLNRGVRVIAHNEDGLVALDKPSGALSHPNDVSDNKRSLLVADYDLDQECYTWTDHSGETRQAWLINRLDSPTSGVILLGLNSEISRLIKQQFATHRITKIYYALVRGKPKPPSGSWSDKLKKEIRRGNRPNGIRRYPERIVSAKARYQLIKSPTGGFPVSLVKLMPLTGRTHQLRVQCKNHGLPIVGDRTYGNFSFNEEVVLRTETKRMMLHSAETIVNYSFKGKVREFTASSELPEEFERILSYRPGIKNAQPKHPRHSILAGRRFKV